MWSMKVITLLLHCYGCLSAADWRPRFSSRNFQNVLQWDPVEPDVPGEEVRYTVQYWSDAKDQQHQTKLECQNITALSCDLTAETPSVFDVHYNAQVLANGRVYGRSYRFKPIAKTVLGQPILSVSSTVSSLLVDVTLPSGPSGISIADIFKNTKRQPFNPATLYTLTITHPKWAAQVNTSTTGQFVLNLKNNNTKYCGYVVYKPSFELGRPPSENTSFCETLPGNPWMLFPWFLVVAALLVVIAAISVACVCFYVSGGKEKSLPEILVSSGNIPPPVLQSPDKYLYISKPEICPKGDQIIYSTIQVKPNVVPVGSGGYSPQDFICQPLPGSSGSSMGMGLHSPTAGQQDTSAQSSDIYSAVGVHVPGEETEGFQQAANEDSGGTNLPRSSLPRKVSWDKGGTGPKLISHVAPPSPELDSQGSNSAGPLLLPTVRDVNGQLIFPALTFQSQSAAAGATLPPHPEGKLHLSDLIHSGEGGPSLSLSLHSLGGSEWSDSGYDQSTVNTPNSSFPPHDSPTQLLLPAFESGYKQNWMPAAPHGITREDSCEHGMTNLLWSWTDAKEEEEEEEEEEEGEERAREIFLGGWVVQIQD
ncbi:interferon lambda receptor 1 [Centroberyx gerrardi]